jgi:hypothetical protein
MDDEDRYDRDWLQEGMGILKTLADDKIIMVREPVPSGSVGISIVFDDERKCHGTLDVLQHKELLLQVAEAIAIEETGEEEE